MKLAFIINLILQFASQTFFAGYNINEFNIGKNGDDIKFITSNKASEFQVPAYYPVPVIIKKYTFTQPVESLHLIRYHYSSIAYNINLTIHTPIPLIINDTSTYHYPGKSIKIKPPAYLADVRLNHNDTYTASVVIFPLKYSESEKQLYILDSLYFTFHLKSSSTIKTQAKNMPPLYLIVAVDSVLGGFFKLALWKKQKGYRVKMLSIEEIESSFAGRDTAEKLRNAIKMYYSDSNLVYVLLGGDVDAVPARVAYAMTCDAHYAEDEDSIRADLYFSDLDGSWDYNNNNLFGEVTDSIDLYPDVYVGRVPADNYQEALSFSEKLIHYEQNPAHAVTNALFFAMILWENPYTNSGESKDYIDTTFFPDYYSIRKLYEAYGNETHASVIEALENGNGFMNHNGHGWWTGMWLNGSPTWEFLDTIDADTIHMAFGGIMYSIGCWVGAFDREDAISEHFVLNPNGPVAVIANSRYGWGSPGNPLYGYSDKFDQNFYRKIFIDSVFHIGITLAEDKADFVPLSHWENVYRWHQYQINLFGDPEMEIHTEYLGEILCDIPDTISEESSFSFTVYDANGNLLNDAKVALTYEDSVYVTTSTSAGGTGVINIPPMVPDSLFLTVYARNHVTLKKWLYVSHGIRVVEMKFKGLNNTDYLFPGDSGQAEIYIKNKSTQPAENLHLSFSTVNINLLQNSVTITDTIYPDSVYVLSMPFTIPAYLSENDTISIVINASGSPRKFLYFIKKPHVLISINGNDSLNSHEDTLSISIINNFFATLYNLNIHTYRVSGNVSFVTDSFYIHELASQSQSTIKVPVEIQDTGEFEIGIRVFNSDFLDDTFYFFFSTYKYDYVFDFEDSLNGFYSSGNWQRTTYRSYSGSYSIWDGENGHYANNANDTFITPWIYTGYEPVLSFYMWYNATTYGQDGIHVFYLNKTGTWTELDYIGSGGALDNKEFTTGWAEYTYILNGLGYGDSTKIMFVLTTDESDTAEGFYIDRLRVFSRNYMKVKGIHYSNRKTIAFPTVVSYALPIVFNLDAAPVISLLDIGGRKIFEIKASKKHGKIIVNTGSIRPGLYFVNVKTPKTNIIKKVVVQK